LQATTPETAPVADKDLSRNGRVRKHSIFTPALFTTICERIAAGESLRSVCRDAEMPSKATVMRWLREKPELRDQYAIARDDLLDHWAEDLIEIADDGTMDLMPGTDKHGNEVMVANHANVQRDRLRIDARKWLMARLGPKKYGDRVEHEMSGEIGHTHRVDISSLTAREKMRRLALFMLEDRAAGQIIEGESTVMTDSEPGASD
jgi:hypothetical protein